MADRFPPSDADTLVDEGFLDEGLGHDEESDIASLASSVLQYRELWGRTYHSYRAGENDYWGPNDADECSVLRLGHDVFKMLLGGKLCLVPLGPKFDGKTVEVACGIGTWAIDFADANTHATVEGVDLSPIQPREVPLNCDFIVDDVEESAIKDWPALYRQAFQKIRPGGYIEHLEVSVDFASDDGSIGEDDPLTQWSQNFVECGERIGKTFLVADHAKGWILEAGFEAVEEEWFKVPIGTWPEDEVSKNLGFWNHLYCDSAAEGRALYLLIKVRGWSYETSKAYIARFREALNETRKQAYYWVVVVWGRKPTIAETACQG